MPGIKADKSMTDFPCPRQQKYKNGSGLITNAQPLNCPDITDQKLTVPQRTMHMNDFNYPVPPTKED